jgi:Mg-chelatase subunit ChlD
MTDVTNPTGTTEQCEIVVVLDRSGSMQTIKTDMEGAFDAFVEAQRALDGVAALTLVQFDSDCIETVYEGRPLAHVPKLKLAPRGWTPLLDAVGQTVTRTFERLGGAPGGGRTKRVIFVVITDGMENASREYSKRHVKTLMGLVRANGWLVMYLGANVDAFQEASQMGIGQEFAAAYSPGTRGVNRMMEVMGDKAAKYRSGRVGEALAFTPDERQEMSEDDGEPSA